MCWALISVLQLVYSIHLFSVSRLPFWNRKNREHWSSVLQSPLSVTLNIPKLVCNHPRKSKQKLWFFIRNFVNQAVLPKKGKRTTALYHAGGMAFTDSNYWRKRVTPRPPAHPLVPCSEAFTPKTMCTPLLHILSQKARPFKIDPLLTMCSFLSLSVIPWAHRGTDIGACLLL